MSDVEQAKAHFFAALDLFDARDYAAAEVRFRAALAIVPDRASGLINLSATLFRQDKFGEAIEVARRALTIEPDAVEALVALGSALVKQRRLDEALVAMERAVAAAPSDPTALMGRASVLTELRRYDLAIADYRAAQRIDPGKENLRGLLVTAQMQACDWTGLAGETDALLADIRRGKALANPFYLLTTPATAADQLLGARGMTRRDYLPLSPLFRGERYDNDRIRVAYVSGDFHKHATAHLMTGVFEHHDRARFETFGISVGPDDGSPERQRLLTAFDHFVDVQERGNDEIAALIHGNRVDIAVDLGGFTEGGRLAVFARRPAPVQVSYLGLPGTTGAPYLDYLVADAVVIPADAHRFYSEKIVTLPDTYQANDDKRRIAPGTPTRREAGLPETGFVFCCFNNNYKIAPVVFDIWMGLLAAVEGSVLWLMRSNEVAAANLRREAAARGVSPDRLVFAPPLPVAEHLARHRLAGLFLDTSPYNAHTTASDALWSGLPVLTCPGSTFPSRVAASLLRAIGLPELITSSFEEYRDLALTLARDPERLAAIRTKLAANRDTTALFDTARFTRHLESAYSTMVERHRRGEAPAPFAVEPVG